MKMEIYTVALHGSGPDLIKEKSRAVYLFSVKCCAVSLYLLNGIEHLAIGFRIRWSWGT